MDKQTGWIASDECACVGEKCVVKFLGVECKPVVFVDPSALASLEQQVETLKAVVGKKDEALREIGIKARLICEDDCVRGRSFSILYGLDPANPCCVDSPCSRKEIDKVIAQALSLSPASVAEYAANATTTFRQTDDDYNTWECGKCHEVWCLNEGSPTDNDWRFCPKCGRRIVEVIPQAKEQDEDTLPTVAEMAGIAPGLKTIQQEAEEYEQIGRAVVEWMNSAKLPADFSEPGAAGYGVAICDVTEVIAKAREVTP